MSLFDKDIVRKDFDTRPEPHDNMIFQVYREALRLGDLADKMNLTPNTGTTKADYIQLGLDRFLDQILCGNYPSTFKGVRTRIKMFNVHQTVDESISQQSIVATYTFMDTRESIIQEIPIKN